MSDTETKLREKAQAVVDRWNSPDWTSEKGRVHTGELIAEIAAALAQPEAAPGAVRWLVGLPGEPLSQHSTYEKKPSPNELAYLDRRSGRTDWIITPLYAAPPAPTGDALDAAMSQAGAEPGVGS